jgi:hypothetical protein
MIDSAFACTSFAVFSNHAYFGMNFDFSHTAMKLLISTNGDMKTFHLAFQKIIGDIPFFAKTAGMNTKGLFASCQEQHPLDANPEIYKDGDIFVFQLYDKIDKVTDVDHIESITGKTKVINVPNMNLHNLFADIRGKAIVTEAGDHGNAVTRMEGKFMVMTNFPNHSLKGKTYAEAEGKGDDRYRICHEYLNENVDQFDIQKGFELLKKACNREPEYPTLCSMVFDPQNSDVYVVLFRDFKNILKVSITNNTVGVWKGYKENIDRTVIINDEGIMVTDLIEYFNNHG